MHLILDIDGTLISEATAYEPIIFRPHLDEFLDFCFETFETVSIWSAAGKDHVNNISIRILPKGKNWLFVKHSEHCHKRYGSGCGECPAFITQKRLINVWRTNKYRNLGVKRENTIIVDNTPEVCVKNYGNAIYIRTFQGESNDEELIKLKSYLSSLVNCRDVRKVEKRGWRNKPY